ncbi:MAG: hypothetical protein RBS53_09595, partial [Bacteroidales bacterium]|nr:hypothetical protein [Bacteroidales bacterium]
MFWSQPRSGDRMVENDPLTTPLKPRSGDRMVEKGFHGFLRISRMRAGLKPRSGDRLVEWYMHPNPKSRVAA